MAALKHLEVFCAVMLSPDTCTRRVRWLCLRGPGRQERELGNIAVILPKMLLGVLVWLNKN